MAELSAEMLFMLLSFYKHKEKLVVWDHTAVVVKLRKHGWLPTPADILVGHLIPNMTEL